MSEAAITKFNPNAPVSQDLKGFVAYVEKIKPQIAQVAAKHLNPDRIARMIAVNVSRTPALAACTASSILRCVFQAVELGLEPGAATGEAYLIPYKTECTLVTGYKGLIALAYRSGHVKSITTKCVYQGDAWDYEEGLNPKLRHVPAHDVERKPGDLTFVYCIVHMVGGGTLHDVMTRGEVDAIRKRSRSGGNGPWVTDYAEMARKTVTKRCLKYAPMSVEMSKALALEEAHESGDPTAIDAEFLSVDAGEPPAIETKTDRLKGQLGAGASELPAPAEGEAPDMFADEETGEVVGGTDRGR